MLSKALGLIAPLLLNQSAGAQNVGFANESLKSQDSAKEQSEIAFAPIVNQSAEWSVQPFRGFYCPIIPI